MDFSTRLQDLRHARNLTVAEAAEVFHVSARTYEGWEQGRITKEWMHAPLLEYFERHAPRRPVPKTAAPRKRRKT